jgi:hypothetical protein
MQKWQVLKNWQSISSTYVAFPFYFLCQSVIYVMYSAYLPRYLLSGMDGLPINVDHIHRLVFCSSTPCQAMICYGSWRTTSLNLTHPWDSILASWLARIWWQWCRSLGLIRRWVYLCTYTHWQLLITKCLDSRISWGEWSAMGWVPMMWQYTLCVRSLACHNAISRWKKFGFCKSFFKYLSNFVLRIF